MISKNTCVCICVCPGSLAARVVSPTPFRLLGLLSAPAFLSFLTPGFGFLRVRLPVSEAQYRGHRAVCGTWRCGSGTLIRSPDRRTPLLFFFSLFLLIPVPCCIGAMLLIETFAVECPTVVNRQKKHAIFCCLDPMSHLLLTSDGEGQCCPQHT